MSISLGQIKNLTQNDNIEKAELLIKNFLEELFGFEIKKVEIRKDAISLNSVNGFIYLSKKDIKTKADVLFFKFHQEENEEELKEYYNTQILLENGYPIEVPLYISNEVGKQVLIYTVKTSERFFDTCKKLDASNDDKEIKKAIIAQEKLDKVCCKKYLASIHEASIENLKDEPILQLFTKRLTDNILNDSNVLGGRYKKFYYNQNFNFPGGMEINFNELSKLKWVVNNLRYSNTLEDSFKASIDALSLSSHTSHLGRGLYTAVIAHGDAHNGNLWYNQEENSEPFLSFFDPAFAGKHIPALLAEVKATFHNIFAHPLWLYSPLEAEKYFDISCKIEENCIKVTHNWELSYIRKMFLKSKIYNFWIPFIKNLKENNLLPIDWEKYIRSALFCCPMLVMNLRANCGSMNNQHTEKTSLLGLSISVMLSSAALDGKKDIVSSIFDAINENI